MSLVTIHGPSTMYDNEEHVAYAGSPGSFASSVLIDPADLAELRAEVGASPNTPWFGGQYVTLVDASQAYWDGNTWESGTAPARTNAQINGASVALTSGTVWWNNAAQNASSWVPGEAPTAAAFPGLPGIFNPLYYKPVDNAGANTDVPDNEEGYSVGVDLGAVWPITAVAGVTTYKAPYIIVGASTPNYWNGTNFVVMTGLETQAASLVAIQGSDVVGGTKLTIATTVGGDGSHNEKQTITPDGVSTGGQFLITWEGQTTAPIAYNADAYTIKLALEALSNIGVGEAIVTGGPINTSAVTVEFAGTLGLQNQDAMTVTTWLTRGAWTITAHDNDSITCQTTTLGDAAKAYWGGAAWMLEATAITAPADLAALRASGAVASPLTAWDIVATAGDPGTLAAKYITLGDASKAYWNGQAWVTEAEAETLPTGMAGLLSSPIIATDSWMVATPGTPGTIAIDTIELGDSTLAYWDGTGWVNRASYSLPANLTALQASDIISSTDDQPWINGEYILTGAATHANWDGDSWVTGDAATATGTAGIPGTITPTGYLPADLTAAQADLTASPLTKWTVGQYVALGDASHAYWTNAAWAAGEAPA